MNTIGDDTGTVNNFWMKLYVYDFLGKMDGHSNDTVGAYLRCMMKYWIKGGPITDSEMQMLAGTRYKTVQQFFVKFTDPGKETMWGCPKLDKELSDAAEKAKLRKERAMKGVRARQELRESRNGKPLKDRIPKKVRYL